MVSEAEEQRRSARCRVAPSICVKRCQEVEIVVVRYLADAVVAPSVHVAPPRQGEGVVAPGPRRQLRGGVAAVRHA